VTRKKIASFRSGREFGDRKKKGEKREETAKKSGCEKIESEKSKRTLRESVQTATKELAKKKDVKNSPVTWKKR